VTICENAQPADLGMPVASRLIANRSNKRGAVSFMRAENVTAESFRGEIRTMWANGPSRRWSPVKIPGATMPLDSGGYGGSYVCQACNEVSDGVYAPKGSTGGTGKWVCGGCRNAEIAANATPRRTAA